MKPNSAQLGKRRRNRAKGRTQPPALSMEVRDRLETALGRRFADPALLDRALTHRSANPAGPAEWSSERLEFLGDRVLGLVIADALLERHPLEREGRLALRLNALVQRDACVRRALKLSLDEALLVDPRERDGTGGLKPSILADAMEAVIGAVYLDGGLPAARTFVLSLWKEEFQSAGDPTKDPKSALQEWAQGDGRATPVYISAGRFGPDHAPVFRMQVHIEGELPALGEGPTKQEAEREAARAMLGRLDAVETGP